MTLIISPSRQYQHMSQYWFEITSSSRRKLESVIKCEHCEDDRAAFRRSVYTSTRLHDCSRGDVAFDINVRMVLLAHELGLDKVRNLAGLDSQHRRHHRFHNTFHTFRTLLQDHGVRECYRGLVPILLRNGPSNALFFALRGPIKQQLPVAQSPGAHMVNDFICGGLLGAMLSFMFYPLNVVKARMQSRVGGAFQPSRAVLLTIWRERDGKVTHLFRGAHLNYHRSILSWGIINATYELLLKFM
ncbi:hypothetical protein AAFF_G00438730 [Aldrovandia affinis]|uniref:Solute carrier family 25 member 51 n=1 Tax=Aldrovandia affinis TaxID=143900 RepID=A0AAD7VYB6_9TELE|nr:hypothetical protein AAFF_G00438730 [Aldrovandia affinis]